MKLIDSHQRRIRKLRVSLLDACNFRCFYCMPLHAKFMDSSKWLTPPEIEEVCKLLCSYGIEQIRITGGEPTLRRDFRDIVQRLSELPIQKLGMTTNGFLLADHLHFLRETSCRHINISLDSLNEENFNRLTRRKAFAKTYSSLLQAKEMGFEVKVNTVLMKGVNDHEVFDFIQFSQKNDIEVRFLEVMKIGQACRSQAELFISADEALAQIREHEGLIPQKVDSDSTSFNFKTSSGAKIGFIASESRPFCNSCSRWRLSADGFLRACLMSNAGLSARELLTQKDLTRLLNMKPTQRIHHVLQDMNQIGG